MRVQVGEEKKLLKKFIFSSPVTLQIQQNLLDFILLRHQQIGSVHLAQFGLFDLTGGIARHFGKNNLPRPLITGQIKAEIIDFRFGQRHIGFDFDDRGGDFPQPRFRQTDHRHVFDRIMTAQKVFDLHRIEVLAAGNDYIFFGQQDR